MGIQLKQNGLAGFLEPEDLAGMAPLVEACAGQLARGDGLGADALGWIELPRRYDKAEFERIQAAAKKIQADSEVLVVIGIGGSYLGARAALEFVHSPLYNSRAGKSTPDIYFVGNNLSSTYINEVIELIGERDFSVNVISKSGTTTEPAIAFRVFKKLLEQKYGKPGAARRIYATTDREKGALKSLADAEGYETFVVPDDIGGRYSVLTAVGLLPMAASGIDLGAVMRGADDARAACAESDFSKNQCRQYAALRHCLFNRGKVIEILVNYEPRLTQFGEWYKQLFAESEGKNKKGIFPTSANFSTDLHSIGQFIQDGSRNLFETVLWCPKAERPLVIEADEANIDGLNFLAGRSMQFVNSKAYAGTLLAHMDGGVPNIVLELDDIDAYHFGYTVYFFEMACALSGYLFGLNPFNQPGVESYKTNMFTLLHKPGYEQGAAQLEQRLSQ
ncbi:glucose-6-phosphate isomerase [Feifania hominis]|uniref:Glucose-6-phosphate isomerase n=1 Tax=Feifania hominis TaxID=2763660 RepID=A0A926DCF4_9FIRM|nr:glucose-6-phosphate isomerase [Feifania hominis]MBC8535312.1 glucose-6-phosphate isomerase [Feifania hominis]